MGGALVQGILRAKLCESGDITVADRVEAAARALAEKTGVSVAVGNAEAVASANVVMLCVKPDDVRDALDAAAEVLADKLIISIAAGVTVWTLESHAHGARVVRAMPNTSALVGRSATAVAPGSDATAEDVALATRILGSVGKVVPVTERQMDAVTGLSGSGPAFIYLVLEAMSDGAVAAGLPRKLAYDLAIETLAGAAEMASSTGEHPAILREMVTSPAGTTSAGLMVLEQCGTRSAIAQAVAAAAARSQELCEN